MNDSILLKDMLFYGYHGLFSEEKRLGQRFSVSLVIETDLRAAAQSDDLSLSMNYTEVYAAVKTIVEGKPVRLLETLAENIAARVLEMGALRVKVTVKKLHPPIPGQMDYVAVAIMRERL